MLILLKVFVNIVLIKFVVVNKVEVSNNVSVIMFKLCIWILMKNNDIKVMIIFISMVWVMLLFIYLRMMIEVGIGDINSFLILCWNLVLKNEEDMLV